MAQSNPPLRVSAQPKKRYRERYQGEQASGTTQRFLQAERDESGVRYPTIEISPAWKPRNNQKLYIHVTLSTVPNERVPDRYIHPYPLTSEDPNVQKDPTTNSLYYLILHKEFQDGWKSFQMTLSKLTQRQLESWIPMLLTDLRQPDAQRVPNPRDTRELIRTYQLNQSQLVFSIQEFCEIRRQWIKFAVSTVYSDVMIGTMPPSSSEASDCRWAPRRGRWDGNDEVIMVIPQIDGRRVYTIRMENDLFDQTPTIPHQLIGKSTISLRTPPCPITYSSENTSLEVDFVIQLGDDEIARMSFTYVAPHRCAQCGTTVELFDVNTVTDYNSTFMDFDELDQEDERDSATLDHRGNCTLDPSSTSNEIKSIRCSLRDKSQNPTQPVSLSLTSSGVKRTCHHLEQANELGDTPLLAAARLNQCLQMESILQQEPCLSQQVNREGNNLLHLLVNLPEEKAMSTVQSIFSILPGTIKKSLILMSNNNGQTPLQLALSLRHRHYHELFLREMNASDENTKGTMKR